MIIDVLNFVYGHVRIYSFGYHNTFREYPYFTFFGELERSVLRMRKYELLIILNPDISEEGLETMIEKITQNIKKEGGEVSGVDKWGKRRLAYEVKRSKKGFYLLVQFSCEPDRVKEIERGLKFVEGIERFMTIVFSEKLDLALSRSYSAESKEEAGHDWSE